MSIVKLKAEIWPGSSIEGACEQLVRLARRLEVDVLADFNGVTLIAQHNGTARALQTNWETEIASSRTHKIANSRPRQEPIKIIDGIPDLRKSQDGPDMTKAESE